MSNLNKMLRGLEKKKNKINYNMDMAIEEIEMADDIIERAEAEISENEDALDDINQVKLLAEDVKEKYDELQREYDRLEPTRKEKRDLAIGYLCFFVALISSGTMFVLKRQSKTGQIKLSFDSIGSSLSIMPLNDDLKETSDVTEEEKMLETNKVTEVAEYEKIENDYTYLTEEDFEKVVGSFVTNNAKKYSNVGTEDILKFISLANIDELVESNEELSKKLFSNPSKEEFLNDVAKVIGSTVMYDCDVWNKANSTKDFIKVSDVIIGSQRDKMLIIEDYVNRIADAVNSDDEKLVNSIIAEFIDDMNIGTLSKLDDGVGFASQIYIALISDVIAKDYLSKENFDMLQILKESEKYVSNIFAVYSKCSLNNLKTRKLQYDYDTNTAYYVNC